MTSGSPISAFASALFSYLLSMSLKPLVSVVSSSAVSVILLGLKLICFRFVLSVANVLVLVVYGAFGVLAIATTLNLFQQLCLCSSPSIHFCLRQQTLGRSSLQVCRPRRRACQGPRFRRAMKHWSVRQHHLLDRALDTHGYIDIDICVPHYIAA